MWELIIEEKLTRYYIKKKKKNINFSVSQQMLCQPHRNTFPLP